MQRISKYHIQRAYFITMLTKGFLFALPIVIIIAIVVFLMRFTIGLVSPLSHVLNEAILIPNWMISIMALCFILVMFIAFGIFVSTKKGRKMFLTLEHNFLSHIPMYSTVNNVIKQFRGVSEKPFEQVVMVDAHGSGCYMTGFVVEYLQKDFVVVYVPTAPNPTNGFVFHVHKNRLIFLDTTAEKAMATVIGMGAGSHAIYQGKEYQDYVSTQSHQENQTHIQERHNQPNPIGLK